MKHLPHFRQDTGATSLIVDGEPYIILGGELGNSTASSVAAMERVWPVVRGMHLNTVLAPVYWELIEPAEGRFDFSSVDALLAGAREHGLRLVLLWFAVWKNSMSTYVPAWVKLDRERFPYARLADGRAVEILSAFGAATLAADIAAYTALLRHLAAVDGERQTVILVQIENEIGFLGAAREHGAQAEAAWNVDVPARLIDRLSPGDAVEPELRALWLKHGSRTVGAWRGVFGGDAAGEEVFTAWHYARFVDRLAAAGKEVYALPTFANAALNRPGRAPGEYPSGGPLPHLLDVWRAAAPAVDMLSPDIYFYDFETWSGRYRGPGNPLFVPEAMRGTRAAANAMSVIGGQRGIGFSPFGIEAATGEDAAMLGQTYAALRHLMPVLTGATPTAAMEALSPRVNQDGTVDPSPVVVTVGDCRLTVRFDGVEAARTQLSTTDSDPATRGGALPRSGGLIVFTEPDGYTIIGTGLTVTHATVAGDQQVGLLAVEEWRMDAPEPAPASRSGAGRWAPYRRLNGDQTHQGRHIRLEPGGMRMQTVRLYRFR